MIMLKVELEKTEMGRFPAGRRWFEAEAGRINDWDDGYGHAAVGQVDAADAAFVLHEHAKEVLVGDLFAMASCLQTSHHELVFL